MSDLPSLLLLLDGNSARQPGLLLQSTRRLAAKQGYTIVSEHHDHIDIMIKGAGFRCSLSRGAGLVSEYKPVFCTIDNDSIGMCIALELGDHIGSGRTAPTIIRQLLEFAVSFGDELSLTAVLWTPAKIASGYDYFRDVVGQYLSGGAFPVLPLVDFKSDGDGEISSAGLSWFSNQEITVSSATLEQKQLVRRAVRIVHDIAVNGPITEEMEIAGLEPNEKLHFRLSQDGNRVDIAISSIME
ncbi:MAG: hypothetical protein HC843_06550 [Sphingomonadales bacterium]|nr:hypothetical protein [Sphingomonadales bacterium]